MDKMILLSIDPITFSEVIFILAWAVFSILLTFGLSYWSKNGKGVKKQNTYPHQESSIIRSTRQKNQILKGF